MREIEWRFVRSREALSSFSVSQDRLSFFCFFLDVFIASLFLFHSPCIHRLSLDFSTSLYFYLCVLFNFNRWFFVIYNERILNGVVVLTNNVIYRFLTYMWLNFRWSFFLHGSTSLIVEINFLSASVIIYSIWLVFNPHNAQDHFTY